MCHRCVTICQIKNCIRRCTLDSPIKLTYEKYPMWPGESKNIQCGQGESKSIQCGQESERGEIDKYTHT